MAIKESAVKKILGVLFVLGLLGYAAFTMYWGKLNACRDAKEKVSESLKSPSSAIFRGCLSKYTKIEESYSSVGSDYTVSSYVESQNGFGAMQKSDYTCKVSKFESKKAVICDIY